MADENTTAPQPDSADDLTTADGRKVTSFSAAGESYAVESTEQAARGKTAEVETQIQEMKLRAMKGGIRRIKL